MRIFSSYFFLLLFLFLPKFRLCLPKFQFAIKILIFIKIAIFNQNFDFLPKFRFCLPKFQFSTKIWIFTKTSIFYQNFNFLLKLFRNMGEILIFSSYVFLLLFLFSFVRFSILFYVS